MLKAIIHNTEKYGVQVSTQDWLKFLAVIIMTIDHIGAYFLTGEAYIWFKAIGRFTFPVWFFFAGYSQSRKLTGEILWWGIFLAAVDLAGFRGILPMNALISIIICRACVLWLRDRNFSDERLLDIFAICLIFSLFAQELWEYGTTGILYAIMGDLVRRGKTSKQYKIFFIFTYLLFMAFQLLGLEGANIIQISLMFVGVGYYTFRLATFQMRPLLWFNSHPKIGYLVRLLGRNTMYYYVIHRTIFVLAAHYFGFNNVENFPILGIFGY